MKTIRVVAAVICDSIEHKTKIFSTARGYGEFKGGWEFPGGKIEAGETPQQAVVREIREELDATVRVGDLIDTIEYDYPAFHLSMDCFWCEVASGELKLLEAEAAEVADEGGTGFRAVASGGCDTDRKDQKLYALRIRKIIMTNEEFQRSKSFEENLKEWNLLSLEEMGESVKEGSLYVIGNGFDMLHGVRSSYYDFSRTLGKRSTVRFYLEKYLKTDDLWADFEGALGKINIEAMCQPYIIDNFLDINGAYDEDAGAAEIYMSAEMAVEPILSMSTELMDRFRKWIGSLHTNTNDRPLCNVIKDGKALNFNYTEFVEDLYGVDAGNICYIHGCRKKTGRGRQRLILGHIPGANDAAYEFEDDYSAIDNLDEHAQLLYDVQQIALQMVVEADDTLTKKCKEIIQSNHALF